MGQCTKLHQEQDQAKSAIESLQDSQLTLRKQLKLREAKCILSSAHYTHNSNNKYNSYQQLFFDSWWDSSLAGQYRVQGAMLAQAQLAKDQACEEIHQKSSMLKAAMLSIPITSILSYFLHTRTVDYKIAVKLLCQPAQQQQLQDGREKVNTTHAAQQASSTPNPYIVTCIPSPSTIPRSFTS